MGRQVILTEETDWLGGQLTSQAVPPDEHPWIEQFGCTATYRALRETIRDYYRRGYPLTERGAAPPRTSTRAQGHVSRLCHEPRVAVAAWSECSRRTGRPAAPVLLRHRPVAAETDGDRVTAVRLLDTANRSAS